MDRVRFEAMLAAYGADPKRWPEAERAEAQAFAAAHPEFAASLAEARAIDALLDAAREPAAGGDLVAARILAKAPTAQPRANLVRPLLALAACAVVGVLVGFGGAHLAPLADPADAALNAAFGDGPESFPGGGG